MSVDYSDFEDYSNSTRDTLISISTFVNKAALTVLDYEFILAAVGVVLNVFHLMVLTRRSMRSTSTNVLMIGIAACDLFIMSFIVYGSIDSFLHPDFECWAPSSYPRLVVDLWASAIKDAFRRISAWLGVLMASVRLIIVKTSLIPKYEHISQPALGWKIILVALLLSSIISCFYWARLELIEVELWRPAEHCSEFPANYTERQYAIGMNDLFMKNQLLALQIFLFTDGFLKILPASILPILTFLLVRELKLAEIARRKINVALKGDSSKVDHTTSLVILMTATFIVAEGPLGIIYVVQGFVTTKPAFLSITNDLIQLLGVFIALNATTHCMICLTMSSQYRSCAKSLVSCGSVKKTMVTVSSKVSVTSATSVRHVIITTTTTDG